jgi:hypothetical protein
MVLFAGVLSLRGVWGGAGVILSLIEQLGESE